MCRHLRDYPFCNFWNHVFFISTWSNRMYIYIRYTLFKCQFYNCFRINLKFTARILFNASNQTKFCRLFRVWSALLSRQILFEWKNCFAMSDTIQYNSIVIDSVLVCVSLTEIAREHEWDLSIKKTQTFSQSYKNEWS